jgi:cyclic pyranopterin monophosphate synthase
MSKKDQGMPKTGNQSAEPVDKEFSGSSRPFSGLESSGHLSHLDEAGRARMVDVGDKTEQLRVAKAEGWIRLQPETVRLVRENLMKKGDVLTVAEIAGIQAAKSTSSLIPLCHTINLTSVKVSTDLRDTGVTVTSEVRCVGQTGVEMEALTAVSVALLTIYDMCKAVDKEMEMAGIRLVEKTKHEITR